MFARYLLSRFLMCTKTPIAVDGQAHVQAVVHEAEKSAFKQNNKYVQFLYPRLTFSLPRHIFSLVFVVAKCILMLFVKYA